MELTEFLSWDDKQVIVENPVVNEGLSLQAMWQALFEVTLNLWHPLTLWSHQADVSLFGLNPDAHHLMALIYHMMAGVCLWWMLGQLPSDMRSIWVKSMTVGLFLLHPMHVESWAWISERKDTLSAAFGFLSLGYWSRWSASSRKQDLGLSLFCLLAGLMSKPSLFVWPSIMLATSWWWKKVKESGEDCVQLNWKRIFVSLAPFLIVSLTVALLTWSIQQGRAEAMVMSKASVMQRTVMGFSNLGTYGVRCLFPNDLCYFYPLPKSAPWGTMTLGFSLFTFMCFLSFKTRDTFPVITWSWLLFLTTLLPTVGFIMSGESAAPDRYSYLPYTGAFICFALGLLKIISHPRLRLGTALLVLLVCSGMSFKQAMTWRNMESLTRHALSINEQNYKAHFALGKELAKHGKNVEAIRHFEKTAEIRPDHADAQIMLAYIDEQLGRFEEARAHYKQLLKYWPEHPIALSKLKN